MKLKRFSRIKETAKKSLSLSAVNFRLMGGSKGKENQNATAIQEVAEERGSPKFSLSAAAAAAAAANSSNSPAKAANDNCLLFEDGDASQEEEITDALPAGKEVEQLSAERAIVPTLLQTPKFTRADDDIPAPGSFFCLPSEVRIDPDAIPPSPMRDPTLNFSKRSSAPDKLLTEYRSSSPDYEFGAPVGDIGMRTQLWDAQRLVRVILGKQNEGPLETGSILQAIRSFAVMKQELILLRKQQEERDQDPPTILESLGSPSTTTDTRHLSTMSVRSLTPQKASPQIPADTSLPSTESNMNRRAIVEAAKKIQSLEQQLQQTTLTIQNLQEKQKEPAAMIQELEQANLTSQHRLAEVETEKRNLKAEFGAFNTQWEQTKQKYNTLLIQHKETVAVFKAQLSDVITKLAQVEPKDAERARSKEDSIAKLEQELEIVKKTSAQQIASLQAKLAEQHQKDDKELLSKTSTPPQLAAALQGKVCGACGVIKSKDEYSKAQWNPKKKTRRCKDCVEQDQNLDADVDMEDELATSMLVEDKTSLLQEELKRTQRELFDKDKMICNLEEAQLKLQSSVALVLDTVAAQKQKGDQTAQQDSNNQRDSTEVQREISHLATIDLLTRKIANLEARNAEQNASVSLLEGTLEALQKGGSSPKVVLKELQANIFKHRSAKDGEPNTKSQKISQKRLQALHDEHQALAASIQVLEGEMKLGT